MYCLIAERVMCAQYRINAISARVVIAAKAGMTIRFENALM